MKSRAVVPMASTANLEKLFERLPRKSRAHLLAMLEHYTAEFRRIANEKDARPEYIAYSVHGLIDDAIARLMATDPNAPRVRCTRGCNACCYLRVTIDPHEAQLLVTFAAHEGIAIDREKLQRQAGSTLTSWRSLAHEDQRCVFNGADGECRVYEHRPSACRKYQVVTDPELCDTAKHPGHEVGILSSGTAEVIGSAALAAFPGSGAMPDLLLKALAA